MIITTYHVPGAVLGIRDTEINQILLRAQNLRSHCWR